MLNKDKFASLHVFIRLQSMFSKRSQGCVVSIPFRSLFNSILKYISGYTNALEHEFSYVNGLNADQDFCESHRSHFYGSQSSSLHCWKRVKLEDIS